MYVPSSTKSRSTVIIERHFLLHFTGTVFVVIDTFYYEANPDIKKKQKQKKAKLLSRAPLTDADVTELERLIKIWT